MIETPDLQKVKVNLHGNRFNLFAVLIKKAFQALFTGKTYVRIKTKLPA